MIGRNFIFNRLVFGFLRKERQKSSTRHTAQSIGQALIELRCLKIVVSYSNEDQRLEAFVFPSESMRRDSPFTVTPFDCLVFSLTGDWDLLFQIDRPVRSLSELRAALRSYSQSFDLIRNASETDRRLQQIVDLHAGHQSAWANEPNSPNFVRKETGS